MCLTSLFKVFRQGNASGNIPSPRVDIDPSQFTLPDAIKTTVQNTNSMEPLIDVGHTVFISDDVSNLNIGDIIIWNQGRGDIIHSIVEIGSDEFGAYYRTQGLNLNQSDPERIRKINIKYLCLGVIWTKGKIPYQAEDGD